MPSDIKCAYLHICLYYAFLYVFYSLISNNPFHFCYRLFYYSYNTEAYNKSISST
ncbi:uncharacterized protein BX663DRAFT_491394 [Cokeromyces recurvatus]|uniref:uncharacterized protein n=1 Tax=Cokeromyces recurvatus TaxID=90255 RepID=UPI00221F982C|nr:uncharacterized protein BX663DRAFT_491394 [Cokeromyces recurvatus]KAI7907591.1 hypothetical protein BX663DRAFT_491394 [Cokeromyces recurvatus]